MKDHTLIRMMPTGLPDTLHGQLYLLCIDRRRGRLDHTGPRLLGMALRAAMLTDLYLNGHIHDVQGMPNECGGSTRPHDPVLNAMIDELVRRRYSSWARAISPKPDQAIRTVRLQLEAEGWIIPRRTIPGFTASRVSLHDDALVESLAERVTRAVRNAIAGLPADPPPLAVGLLGVVGQLPTVFSFEEASHCRDRLRDLIDATIEPILGLHEAVLWQLRNARNEIGYIS
ncbi:GOLPH3/VPS74 family protein [Mycobacterium sp. Root265]|uniref:GOLPH3/VPS74 family protein n=1 Tax=Mycobacterium sp. Root265 TaxID=1736504 RepID=UPI000B0FC29D|nr:GPP34 family phosphoprotein [Mycobacterium sp. Root265]